MTERDIPAENLEIWHRAAAENRELRLLQIAEMARNVAHRAEGDEGDGQALRLPTPSLPCSKLVPDATGYARAMALDEQMAFCRALLKSSPTAPKAEPRTPPPAPRVARLAGPVFDKAFRYFSPLLGTGRPIYLSSLGELLEELAAGNADFAMLPLEDAKGVRFLHFFEEFDRLELHITHTCHVPSEESGKSIRFALLSKQYTPTARLAGERLLEYRVSGRDQGLLTELLMAASATGLALYRVDSIPDPYFEDGFVYHVILSVGSEGDEALLNTYLGIALPRVASVGRYIHLKEGKHI